MKNKTFIQIISKFLGVNLIPSELRPITLDLSSSDLDFINALFVEKDVTAPSYSQFSEIILNSYYEGILPSSPGIIHLLCKLNYFASNYSSIEKIAQKHQTAASCLWNARLLIDKFLLSEVKLELKRIEEEFELSLLEKAYLHNLRVRYVLSTSDYPKSIKEGKKALSMLDTISDPSTRKLIHQTLLHVYISLAYAYRYFGEIDKASEVIDVGYSHALDFDDKFIQGRVLNIKGLIAERRGEYDHAWDLYTQGYDILLETGDFRTATVTRDNRAELNLYKGNFNEALNDMLAGLEFWKLKDHKRNLIIVMINISKTYLGLRDLEKTYYHANNARNLIKETDVREVWMMCELAGIFLSANNIEKCEDCLNLAASLLSLAKSPFELAYFNIVQGGLELKKLNLGLAEDRLNKGLNEVVNLDLIELVVRALFTLVELQITKFTMTGNKDELVIADQQIRDLDILFSNSDLIKESFELLLVRATLAKVQLDYEKSLELLNRAIEISQKANYKGLFQTAIEQKEQLLKEWTADTTDKSHIIDELNEEMRKLDEVYQLISGRKLKTSESSVPTALMVILPGGIPLFTYDFNDQKLKDFGESLIISGLLRAINDLSSEIHSLNKKTSLKGIKYQEHSILLEVNNQILFALITSAETFEQRHMLRIFANELVQESHLFVYPQKITELSIQTFLRITKDIFRPFTNVSSNVAMSKES
jgi:tetratricopeptide (TPR) repeat protein